MWLVDPREPVSAYSHGAGLILAVAGSALLWRSSRGDRGKQLSLLVYGLTMALCYASSALYHAVRGAGSIVGAFRLLDHVCVYLYIAGSYTTLGWNVLRGRWRRGTLSVVWLGALVGAGLKLRFGAVSPACSTAFYLAMSWGLAFIYVELARRVASRDLRPVLTGGLIYSLGAAVKMLQWPNVWPGIVGPHEVFHLFVLAGSLVHFRFIVRVVVPYEAPDEPGWTPALGPWLALSDRSWTAALDTLAAARPVPAPPACPPS